MRYFSFEVLGWCNTQVVKADNLEEARLEAESIGHDDVRGLSEISEQEYWEIVDSWGNT